MERKARLVDKRKPNESGSGRVPRQESDRHPPPLGLESDRSGSDSDCAVLDPPGGESDEVLKSEEEGSGRSPLGLRDSTGVSDFGDDGCTYLRPHDTEIDLGKSGEFILEGWDED